MTLTRSEQSLLDALNLFPPHNIYDDAGRREILRGFKLHVGRRATRIHWDGDGALVVDVDITAPNALATKVASVRIRRNDRDLLFDCSCGSTHGEGKCEHVICALVTVLHLLRPKLFRMGREDLLYRTRLETGLLKKPLPIPAREERTGKVIDLPRALMDRAYPRFHVIIEASGKGLKAFAEINGRRAGVTADFRSMPWEIAYLIRCDYQQDMSYPMSVFLKRADNLYPLLFQEGSQRHEVRWLGERTFPTGTELDKRNGTIILRKTCSAGDDGFSPAVLAGNFAFDANRSQMCHVSSRQGWQFWDRLRDLCMDNPTVAGRVVHLDGCALEIPVDTFRGFQIWLKKSGVKDALGAVQLKVDGKEAPLLQTQTTRFKLVITRRGGETGGFAIRPECWSGDYRFRPSERMASFVRAVEWEQVPASIRTKKRKPLLYDAFFQALAVGGRKGIGETISERINESTFGRRRFVTEARRHIRHTIDGFRAEEAQLHFTEQGWRLISLDKEREKLLFLLPYRAFGPALFDLAVRTGEVMAVSEGDLFERLHILHALALQSDIEISLDDYPIESVAWDLELDATEGTIDWFEIRPEIRCNGRTIPREVWEQALARRGVMIRDGAIQVLDQKSLQALSMLDRLRGGTKAAPGQRNITSIPRLRIIELFSLRKQGIAVRLTPEDEAVMTRLTRFDRIEERPVPEGLEADLRHYQKQGYHWLAFLYEHRFGACLADDMGLGKTIQAISLMAAIKEGKVGLPSSGPWSCVDHPFLIVVPPSLIFNWEREIERFYPGLKVYVYRGRERSAKPDGYDVVLTSYGLIRRDIDKLKETSFDVIIFDEAQAIKNIFAGTTNAVRQLKGHFKIALTGTPVENHVGEYFSIMDLVLPGLLGEYREFQGRAREDLAGLLPVVKERTRPFMLRRTKEHILKELPPKVERDVYLELTEQQKKFYNRTVQEVRSTIDAAYRGKTAAQAKIIALTAIMKLRQICLSPQLLVADLRDPAPKVEFLKDKLDELFSESHSALVFSQFTSFLDLVEGELRSKGTPLFRLDGSTPVPKRKEIVDAFQDSREPSVFLLSLKAGGQGLNLTRAAYVFHLDPWWNPAVENQASDRSHRIGQANKVIVTRLLMRHTVEEKMVALKNRKLGLYRALMEAPDRSAGKSVTREDFEFLLS